MSPAIGSPPARRAGGSFAVVGSGVTGLAAAARLLERGFAVTLFESGPRTGGHISAAPFAGRTIDLGPEALGPGTDLDRLLERIGLAGSVCLPARPRAFDLIDGQLVPCALNEGAQTGIVGGISTLTDRLTRHLRGEGAEIRLGTAVRSVGTIGGFVRLELADGRGAGFDGVVLATGPAAGADLLATAAPSAAAALRRVRTMSVTLIHLAYPEGSIGIPLDGTGYLAQPMDGRAVTGCTWLSSKWAHLAGDPPILRASMREIGPTRLADRPDRELVELAHREMEPVMKLSAPPQSWLVTRHPDSLAAPGEEHEGLVAAARAGLGTLAAPAGLVGAYLDGPGIARAVSGVNRTVDAMTTEVITK